MNENENENENENATIYNFRLLREEVESDDFFEDKVHHKIANNLYQIICKNEKGLTIGLEGNWGAGKSTVINLLHKQINNNNLFFVFDAWAHEGDPLRRIFLESLIRTINQEHENENLNEIKKKITTRAKTVEVKSIKTISRLGKFISFAALNIPIGVALLNKVKLENLILPISYNDFNIIPFIMSAIILVTCPFWVLLYWSIWGDKVSGKISWEFFSTESIENYTQDIIEDGERTSIEFEDNFNEIIQIALKKYQRIIIVIDNLDRIHHSQAKNIWSTLQTFFQNHSLSIQANENLNNLWFIIPYDYSSFIKLWDGENPDNKISNSLIRKSFQVIMEIPLPIMSGWVEFTNKLLSDNLNGLSKDECARVLVIFTKCVAVFNKSLTPRDIKSFVNQLLVLRLIWKDSMSFEAISLYSFLRLDNSVELLKIKLIDGEITNKLIIQDDSLSLNSELAGMIYGVDKSKGLQLLLNSFILDILKNNNESQLLDLLFKHKEGFWVAYFSCDKFSNIQSSLYKISITNCLYVLKEYSADKLSDDIFYLTKIWQEDFHKIDFSKYDITASIEKLIEINKPEIKNKLINDFKHLMENKLKNIIKEVNVEHFKQMQLINVEKFVRYLNDLGENFEELIIDDINLLHWLHWLSVLKAQNVSFPMILPNSNVINELIDKLSLNIPEYNKNVIQFVFDTITIKPESKSWNCLADDVIFWLGSFARDDELIFDLALFLFTKKIKESEFKKLLLSEKFWFYRFYSNNLNIISLSILTAIILKNELFESSNVNSKVKEFWKTIPETPVKEKNIMEHLNKYNQKVILKELSQDDQNSLAIHLLSLYAEDK